MQYATLELSKAFKVLFSLRQVQAEEMVIAPGDREGGPDNRHRGADQWLFVVDGAGEAIVDGHTQALQAGSLIAIERGQAHEIRNTGDTPLKTVNFYHPPAYDAQGEPLPAGEG
ncbi:cupin domain-containing protein [Xanthomonas campestris pv. raphani]|uniref:cupin domain-containing protein n=1 Tax=Xanthomonas campestris TaxID=339 RepID=UPI00021AF0B3|nr:cupin domain-containing protein [Xanthomonas campestris]AEL06212.1 tetracenomycin polyketide synthesis protein [Xanthomonas campestris pv. raphani 756C]MEA9676405.1 cupin domain-containing protein [Xanthomonas campestris pv. raphani]MEA9776378.1 cupin domain-containing protein [Xanthomonas campestris pv. raphani]MEA9916929.1 cupin domain-containing protein [Xanthomonas campestris pv. raphani]